MKFKTPLSKAIAVFACLWLPLLLSAQCPAGQANVTIRVYGDAFVDTQTGITCTINGTAVALTPATFASTTTNRWHEFTIPCRTIGGNLVVSLIDLSGNGIGTSISGNNVFVYVNNEQVNQANFTGFTTSITSPFTTNIGPNSTCATASANTVAVYNAGSSPSGYANVVAQNPAAEHTGFEQLPGTTRTECGTFVATASSMDFFAYAGQSGLPTTTTFGPVSMQVFNSACTQQGSTLTAQGGTISSLVPGQTYTFCGTRSVNEQATYPTSTAVLTGIALGTRPSIILPLQLLDFYGVGNHTQNFLTWRTANEQDLTTYEIQKSIDASNYSTIAVIPAKNNYANQYQFTDVNIKSTNNFYRLKINGLNNEVKYSPVINLQNSVKEITISNISPNPAINTVNIAVLSPAAQPINYQVIDVSGKTIAKGSFNIAAGNTNKQLDVSAYPAGILFFKMYDKNNKLLNTQKILKQ